MVEPRRRHRPGIVRAGWALLAVPLLVAACGTGHPARTSTGDTTPPSVFPVPAAPNTTSLPAVVTVTGTGRARSVTVLVGDTEKVEHDVALPYTTNVRITASNPQVSVAAQAASAAAGTTIACRIAPKGATPTASSASGPFATTTCTLGVTASPDTTVAPAGTTATTG
jgi:hypothetical protein